MKNTLFDGFLLLYAIAVIAMIVVIVAIAMDLISGWRKARERGDAHTSYAFSRTITKFLLYEGALVISCGIDTLIHFVWAMIATDTIYVVPCVTCLVGIVLCAVEIWSMREKADRKTRNNLNTVLRLLADHLTKEQISELLHKLGTTQNGEK